MSPLVLASPGAPTAPELEASGQFVAAAQLLEKTQTAPGPSVPGDWRPRPSADPLIRAALLYEMAGKPAERARVIARLSGELVEGARLSSSKQEELFVEMARDSRILNERSLNLPLGAAVEPELAEALEDSGIVTARTERILLSAPRSTGAAWGRHVRESIASAERRAEKIASPGERARAFEALAERAEFYWDSADSRTRIELSRALEKARRELAQAGLPEPKRTLESVVSDRVSASAALPVVAATDSDREHALQLLREHPGDAGAWMILKTYFEERHQPRLALFCAEHAAPVLKEQ